MFVDSASSLPSGTLSDYGFWQTLKVRTLGCARRSLPLPTHVSSPRKRSKLHEEQHKGCKVYTSSGHHCGVIPYSSLWCGGLPQGLMMNNTRKNYLARGVLGLVILARVQLLDPPSLRVASPIYRARPWASSQILSGKGANNWPF